uniref:Helitron helicase-like domain-containing protein n=1 Tax=Lactuca sativa TaxID=4236 RepID=A0A9R1VCJ3_LACSA|nr:hypothetical protein LSAT_V11C500262970 [Lactuca sativa]
MSCILSILHFNIHYYSLMLRMDFETIYYIRTNEISLILRSRKLFQQFLVDSYTMPTLRVAPYRNLAQAAKDGIEDASLMGNRIIIPSSFTDGSRYMQPEYLDAMTLVKRFGYPNLFLTLTCNPKWPEVIRFVEAENLKLYSDTNIQN